MKISQANARESTHRKSYNYDDNDELLVSINRYFEIIVVIQKYAIHAIVLQNDAIDATLSRL